MAQEVTIQADRLYLGVGAHFVHVNPEGSDWAGTRGCADPKLVSSFLRAPRQEMFLVEGTLWSRATSGEVAAARDLWGGVCVCERLALVDADVSTDEVDPWIDRVASGLALVLIPVAALSFVVGVWVLAVQR